MHGVCHSPTEGGELGLKTNIISIIHRIITTTSFKLLFHRLTERLLHAPRETPEGIMRLPKAPVVPPQLVLLQEARGVQGA